MRDVQALHTDLCVDREKWRVWFGVCRLILEIQLREEYSVVGLGFRFLSITCCGKKLGPGSARIFREAGMLGSLVKLPRYGIRL
jgi:hypothetical protein